MQWSIIYHILYLFLFKHTGQSFGGSVMLKLCVLEKLNQMGKTKYWLYKQMGMSYQNFSRMVNGETRSIKFSNLELLCNVLDCEPGDLFVYEK
ncbi:helix-turn-helix transcriptional regulator [Acetanaerobacterium sp. MSJ-12]|uniref:helix-turn-helix domain-containing protein n=2 Tax=Oscillospiraceae TaxID=216572 RepID=UPI00336C2816